MGRTATVTYEQVAAVADAMKVEGINSPPTRAVRERLGNTGSMGTINKFLAEWKSGQKRQISAALVLPPALQSAILNFMDAELTSARTALESDLADQQQEAADLAVENERQCEENDAQATEIERLRAEVASHLGRAGQLETDLIASREESSRERMAAESARTELAKAQLRLEAMPRLEADLSTAREALDVERNRRQAAEQAAAVSAARLEALQAALQEAAKREQIALADASTANASLDTATKSLAESQQAAAAALDAERTKRQAAEQAAAVSATRLEALQEAYKEATKREQIALADASTANASLESATKSLATAEQAAAAALDAERTKRQSAEQSAAVSEAHYQDALERLKAVTERNVKMDVDTAKIMQELTSATLQVQVQQVSLDAAAREIEALKAATGEAVPAKVAKKA